MFGENLSNVKYIPLYSIFLLLMTICGYNLSEILPSQYRKDIKKSNFCSIYLFIFYDFFPYYIYFNCRYSKKSTSNFNYFCLVLYFNSKYLSTFYF